MTGEAFWPTTASQSTTEATTRRITTMAEAEEFMLALADEYNDAAANPRHQRRVLDDMRRRLRQATGARRQILGRFLAEVERQQNQPVDLDLTWT